MKHVSEPSPPYTRHLYFTPQTMKHVSEPSPPYTRHLYFTPQTMKHVSEPSPPYTRHLHLYFTPQTMKHGAILAKIALIYKVTEKVLANVANMTSGARGTVEGWHTFAAGCLGKRVSCSGSDVRALARLGAVCRFCVLCLRHLLSLLPCSFPFCLCA